jgi:acyl carrier protein
MKNRFIELFKEALENEELEINMEDNFRDYDEWDSLTLLTVIAMIDEEYEIIIEGDRFDKLQTVGDVYNEIVKNKS